MCNWIVALFLVCVLLFMWQRQQQTEGYKSCLDCDDDIRMTDGGTAVKNPFIWPYSGTADVDRMYQMNPSEKPCFGFKDEPMIHLTTPDHVLLM